MALSLSRPSKQLTFAQECDARRHYSRLLALHPGATQAKRALLWANAKCLALHPERLTSEHGHRLIRQLAAKRTNQNIRAQGRTPGDEGRAVARRNQIARKLRPLTDYGLWKMPRT